MPPLEPSLETFFDSVRTWRRAATERWDLHANRRTLLISVVLGALALHAYLAYIRPPESFPTGELVTIPQGATLRDAADTLGREGVVRSSEALVIVMRLWGKENQVHAGDYLFKQPLSLFGIARAVAIGAYGLEPVRIRIPEGASTKDMARIFDKALLRFDPDTFITLAQPHEGYLFPDTYFFPPNARENALVATMRDTFDGRVTSDPSLASTTRPFADIVTMASLVEREARNPADRRLIAGVLWNRLDRGMLLQVDAAFRYSSGKGTFELTTKDLTAAEDPYNTYVHKGLPPTPIGSPSLDSLDAAAHPTKNDYLFYLADKQGVTHYSKTYEEHLRLKRKYLGT
jgi:UPF0755 protein